VRIPVGKRRGRRQYEQRRNQQSGEQTVLRHSTPPH
jgi:hypothetical protein